MAEPLDEDEKTKLDALLDWIKAEGGKLHKDIYFARDKQMGLSPFASNRLEADVVAINIPVKLCITTSLAKNEIGKLLGEKRSDESDVVSDKEWILLYLVLHKLLLLYEKGRREKGKEEDDRASKRIKTDPDNSINFLKHATYVNLLPEEILTPRHYNVDEMVLLRSTPLFNHAIQRHQETREVGERLSKWMLQKLEGSPDEGWTEVLKDQFKLPISLQSPETEEELRVQWKMRTSDELYWCEDEKCWPLLKLWRWAETVHGSRAFPPRLIEEHDSAPILIPGFDLFNHSREARVTWTLERANSQKEIEHDCATLTLHNKTGKNRQVFNSYGPKSNESLLASYGFVNDGMEDDTVTLKLAQKQTNGAKEQSSDTKEMLHYWRFEEECPSDLLEQVKDIIRANVNPEEEKEDIDSFAPDAEEEEREYIKENMYEQEAYGMIAEMAEKKLKSLQNEKIEEARENKNIRPQVLYNIEIYRKGQTRTLEWAIEHANQKSMEMYVEMNNSYY